MKNILVTFFLVVTAVLAWRVGERLSDDAIAMGIGVVFGALAAIPAALLVLAGNRRSDRQQSAPPSQAQLPAPPLIIIAGQASPRHHQVEGWRTDQIEDHDHWQ